MLTIETAAATDGRVLHNPAGTIQRDFSEAAWVTASLKDVRPCTRRLPVSYLHLF